MSTEPDEPLKMRLYKAMKAPDGEAAAARIGMVALDAIAEAEAAYHRGVRDERERCAAMLEAEAREHPRHIVGAFCEVIARAIRAEAGGTT